MTDLSYEQFAAECEHKVNIPKRMFHKEHFGEDVTFDYDSQVNRLSSSPDVAFVEIYGQAK